MFQRIMKAIRRIGDAINDPKLNQTQDEFERERVKLEQALGETRVENEATIALSINCCQQIFGSDFLKTSNNVKQIQQEFDGGEYHKRVQELAKQCCKEDPLQNSILVDIDTCKKEECKERGRCNLRFIVQNKCVWLELFLNINDAKKIGRIIYHISKYMEESEKETENKFTF